jgi:hypothetical protein
MREERQIGKCLDFNIDEFLANHRGNSTKAPEAYLARIGEPHPIVFSQFSAQPLQLLRAVI